MYIIYITSQCNVKKKDYLKDAIISIEIYNL